MSKILNVSIINKNTLILEEDAQKGDKIDLLSLNNVDLSQFNNDENAVNVTINNDELTVKGEIDKKIRGSEKIIRFTQTYYLNENLDETKITKERKGDKYIITIPFKTKENND